MFEFIRKRKIRLLKEDYKKKMNNRLWPHTTEFEEYNSEYRLALSNLDGAIKSSSFTKGGSHVVMYFSSRRSGVHKIFESANLSRETSKKDILKYMSGNVLRLYIHILERKLTPHVKYATDCAGTSEGLGVWVSL